MNRFVRSWSDEALVAVVGESSSYRDIARRLNLSDGASNYKRIKKRIAELGLDVSHFQRGKQRREYSDEALFSFGDVVNQGTLRNRALKILPYICARCENRGSHLGESLVLQLDHISGDKRDNRIENLRWLCPNCHSQTKTFGVGSRNK